MSQPAGSSCQGPTNEEDKERARLILQTAPVLALLVAATNSKENHLVGKENAFFFGFDSPLGTVDLGQHSFQRDERMATTCSS